MRSEWIVGVMGIFGVMGCATSNGVGERDARGVAMHQPEGVVAGQARVVDAHINPRVPVHVTSENGALAIRFAHPRAVGALVHLDPESLSPVSPEEQVQAENPSARATRVVRAVLRGGRFIECWRRGNIESGFLLMAQAWTAHGSPLGPPTAVSPPEADVFATPDLVAVDGEHAVAVFEAASGEKFELLAVALEIPGTAE
jgi:hypothetical protein